MDAALPLGEHGARKAGIPAHEPTPVARIDGKVVLQRRVVAWTSAEIDRASAGI